MSHFKLTCFAKKKQADSSEIIDPLLLLQPMQTCWEWNCDSWLYDTKCFCFERAVVRDKKKRNDLEQSPWSWMYFLSLGEIAPVHILLKFFNGDKILVATCSLGFTRRSHPSVPPFFNNFTRCCWAKTSLLPWAISSWVRKQKHIDVSILFTLSSLFLSFPMFHCLVTFCLSIYPSLPSLLHSSFTFSFTHKKKHVLALKKKLCPCTKTDTSPVARPLFHSADEIFKQHFCSYLIACQHTLHKDSNCSVLGGKSVWGHWCFLNPSRGWKEMG